MGLLEFWKKFSRKMCDSPSLHYKTHKFWEVFLKNSHESSVKNEVVEKKLYKKIDYPPNLPITPMRVSEFWKKCNEKIYYRSSLHYKIHIFSDFFKKTKTIFN